MSTPSISSNYLLNSMLQPVLQTQTALSTLTTETSTGQYADLGQQLGAQSGYELSLKNQYEILQGYTASNGLVSDQLSTSAGALTSIASNAQSVVQDLTTWLSGTSNSAATLQSLGSTSLAGLTASANSTTPDGQYVFSGIDTGTQPLADYNSTPASATKTAVEQAFVAQFGVSPTDPAAANISAADMTSFLTTTFANQFQGTNWTTNMSSASDVDTTALIAPGQSVTTSVNTNQPGFSTLAEGYAMLAEFGGSALSQSAQQAVAQTAFGLISQGLTQVTSLQTQIGTAQGQVTAAGESMASQSTLLQTQIGDMDNVNEYQIATQLSTLTTQLQTSYSLTAKLQSLNLAQYLPVT